MDSRTHVEFARRLIALCGGSPHLSLASLFPQIDRDPPTLHRLYAHSVFKSRMIVRAGLHLFAGQDAPAGTPDFVRNRFGAEAARMLGYADGTPWPSSTISAEDETTGLLACVSHLYLDTFNQPTQTFAPRSVYCSGQWTLWEQIGDFRLQLYTTDCIDQLRREVFASPLWTSVGPLSAAAQIEAMLLRLCELSLGRVETGILVPALQSLGLQRPAPFEVRRAHAFLIEAESLLCTQHRAHLPAYQPGQEVDGGALRQAH